MGDIRNDSTNDAGTIVCPAAEVPSMVLKAATGQLEGSAKFSGLILDEQSLIDIKRYETKGLSLPTTLGDVYGHLGYDSKEPGLTNADLLTLFKKLNSNVKSWSPIENDLLNTSINLDTFADEMNEKGTLAMDFLMNICVKYADDPWPDLTPDQMTDKDFMQKLFDGIKNVELDRQKDALMLNVTAITVEGLLEVAELHYTHSLDLQRQILLFQDGVTEGRSHVADKETLCDRLDKDMTELTTRRDDLKKRISKLSDEYTKDVLLAFSGAPLASITAGISLAITGGIFGSQAEKIRKEKNKCKDELKDVQNQLAAKKALVTAVTFMAADLAGLEMVMTQAMDGVKQLVATWDLIIQYLQLSHGEVKKVHTSHDLQNYWVSLINAVNAWKNVKGNAERLTQVMKNAIKNSGKMPQTDTLYTTMCKIHAMKLKSHTALSASAVTKSQVSAADYPEIDLKAAKDALTVITGDYDNINSSTFPDQYQYITDIYNYSNKGFDQMTGSITHIMVYSEIPASIIQINKMIKVIAAKLRTETDKARIENLEKQQATYYSIGRSTIRDIISKVINEKDALNNAQRLIKHADLDHDLSKTEQKIIKQLDDTQESITAAKTKMEEAEEKQNELQESLDVLEKNNLFKKLAEGAPTLEDVTAACEASSDPEMQAALVGLKVFKSAMEVLGDLFNEAQMQKAIGYYADKANDYRTDMYAAKRQQHTLQGKHVDITNMLAITKDRYKLTKEMQPLIQAFDMYQATLEKYLNEDRDFNRITQAMNTMHTYLDILDY